MDQRLYDCSVDEDRWDLLRDAIDSAKEAAKISKRTRRGVNRVAAEGRPHGLCPVGFRRIYDERTGDYIRQEINPDKAPLIRELFARLRRGHTFKAIERDWEARGIRNPSGTPYSASQLRSMALNPAYAGLRVHSPGRKPGQPVGPDATTIPAAWPAIVPKTMFYAVSRTIKDPARKTHRSGAAKHSFTVLSAATRAAGR